MLGTGRVLFWKVTERDCGRCWKQSSPEKREVHPGAGLLKGRLL